jgi:urease accessory protein
LINSTHNDTEKVVEPIPEPVPKNEALPSRSRQETANSMQAGQWQASLNLAVENRSTGARLVNYQRLGPLHVQKAFYPEGPDLAHLYLLHPPGGLVSGDSLTITVKVATSSAALVTTPGAGRLYGARDSLNSQLQENQLSVGKDASLEWFPMETLFYNRSMGVSKTRVDIQAGGRFMGWDICSLGLPASGKPFTQGELRQTFDLYYDGDITWLERWRFNAQDTAFLNNHAGLSGFSANGVFVAGPFEQTISSSVIDELRILCQTVRSQQQGLAGISQVKHWLVIRYVGSSTTHARECFTRAWLLLRPLLLNRTASPPRIWAC